MKRRVSSWEFFLEVTCAGCRYHGVEFSRCKHEFKACDTMEYDSDENGRCIHHRLYPKYKRQTKNHLNLFGE